MLGIPNLTVREQLYTYLVEAYRNADFYMMPDLPHQPEIVYSYIVEVKYARRDASSREIESLKAEAAGQSRRYAADAKVRESKGDTKLRLITLIFKGWDLVFCD